MRAARIHRFGGPEAIVIDEIARPSPKEGEVVVKVAAAGVGNWDALIREGKSAVNIPLPITLGSDLAGTVESVGSAVAQLEPGEEVYGATNKAFCGAYAEYAVAAAGMIAPKPKMLNLIQAASVPVVAVTAWQMLYDYGQVKGGQTVLIQGGAGNVGRYAVQLAKHLGARVYATAGTADVEYVRNLGADEVVDHKTTKFEDVVPKVDAVLDTVGGQTQHRSIAVLKPGGILVSSVSPVPEDQQRPGVRSVFFLVDVSTSRLNELSRLFDGGQLSSDVGTVLRWEMVRAAHEVLAGAPHKRGKIVLEM